MRRQYRQRRRRSQSLGERRREKPVVGPTSKKPKPARKRKRTVKGAEPEVRRAIPLDYVTTDDVNLRAAPDMAAAKMNGGLLGKGTRVKIAPQDWWYVEVEHPMTASGVLRGWVSNSVLRRATDDDKGPTTPLPEVPAPPNRRPMLPPMPCCEKKWLNRS